MKLSQEICAELNETATKIATLGKGILAADESTGTIGKRFAAIGVENNQVNRRRYRQYLFSSENMQSYISGVILFDETINDVCEDGKTPLIKPLQDKKIIPGIKVDMGLTELMGTEGEQATQGLDGLSKRCQNYYEKGARFAKWRAVLKINKNAPGESMPTNLAITETAHTLARYASICQQNRLVPIVEPEILTDGNHSIEVCAKVTERVLAAVVKALNDHHIVLEGCMLKPNMVTSGADCPTKDTPTDVAFYTVRTLERTIPPALVSINFLSGGQSEEESTLNLNAISGLAKIKNCPWNISFSFGRALQATALKKWGGVSGNEKILQAAFMERAKANGEAQMGKYKGGEGGNASTESLYEKNYVY